MSLQVWLPLNGNIENKGLDPSVNMTGAPATWFEHGRENLLGGDVIGSIYSSYSSGSATKTRYSNGDGTDTAKFVHSAPTASGSWHYTGLTTAGSNFSPASLKANTNYTVSFWYKSSFNSNCQLSIKQGNSTNLMTNQVSFTITGDNTWRRAVITLKTISSFSGITLGSQLLYLYGAEAASGTIEYKWLKMEEGANATEYVPKVAASNVSTWSKWKPGGKLGREGCASWDASAGETDYNTIIYDQYVSRSIAYTGANTDFSYALWIKKYTYNSPNSTWFAFTVGRASYGSYGYGLQYDTGNLRCWYGSQTFSIPDVSDGGWAHVTFVKKGSTCYLFLNGVLKSTNTFTGTHPTYADSEYRGLGLGGFWYSSSGTSIARQYPFRGSINDFRIYDHALSKLEVQEIYNTPVLHYKLDKSCFRVFDDIVSPMNTSTAAKTNLLVNSSNWYGLGKTPQDYYHGGLKLAAGNGVTINEEKIIDVPNPAGTRVFYTRVSFTSGTTATVQGGCWFNQHQATLTTGSTYTLSFWAKGTDGKCFSYTGVAARNSNPNGHTYTSFTGTAIQGYFYLNSDWTHYSVTFTAVSTDLFNCFYIVNKTKSVAVDNNKGEMYVCGVMLVSGSTPGKWSVSSNDPDYEINSVRACSESTANFIPETAGTHNIQFLYDVPDSWSNKITTAANNVFYKDKSGYWTTTYKTVLFDSDQQNYNGCPIKGIYLHPGSYQFTFDLESVSTTYDYTGVRIYRSGSTSALVSRWGLMKTIGVFTNTFTLSSADYVGILPICHAGCRFRMKLERVDSVTSGYLTNDPEVNEYVPDLTGLSHNAKLITTSISTINYEVYDSSYTGANYRGLFQIPDPIHKLSGQFSIACWIKTSATTACIWNGRTSVGSSVGVFIIDGKIRFDVGTLTSSTAAVNTNSWVHICCTWKGGGSKIIYINGVADKTVTTSEAITSDKENTYASIGVSSANNSAPDGNFFSGNINDFRIYTTQLSADEVRRLAKVRESIDNGGNIYAREIKEIVNKTSPSFSKSSVIEVNKALEYYPAGDSNIYFEPDGTSWLKIYHHNNPAAMLFSSSDDFTKPVWKSSDVWWNMCYCNSLNKWELMIKQCATAGSSVYHYRWVQSKNPMTAAFADVASASVVKNSSYGYTVSSYGGLHKNTSNCYLCANNGTSGNWYGAIGSWTAHQGGIPGYNGVLVTTGFLDVYVRIDNVNFTGFNANIQKSGSVANVNGNQLIEF